MTRVSRRLLAGVEARVRARLSPGRLRHVEAVVRTASRLARRHGVPVDRARMAAWLHDAARETSLPAMRRLMRGAPRPWDALERRVPELRHPKAGAALARLWGVKDREVLRAVEHHTMGRPGMGTLEMVIFVSDFVEPGRRFPEARRARRAAPRHLAQAALVKADSSLRWLRKNRSRIHPRLASTREWLARIARKELRT